MKSRFAINFDSKIYASFLLAGNLCWPAANVETEHANFEQDNCFRATELLLPEGEKAPNVSQDLSEIIFFGNGSTSTFAGCDARAFVKKFKSQFEAAKGRAKAAKLEVKHLYFIDHATSVGAVRRVSFAQSVVNKLHSAGFKNVVVHRVEKPAKCKKDVFITTLNEQGRVDSRIELAGSTRDRQPRLAFAVDANPMHVLNQPAHTFKRGENKFTKRARVARELIKFQCAAQIAAINEFRVLAKTFNSDVNRKKAKQIRKQLKTIVHQLKLADKHEWLSTLREANAYLSHHQRLGAGFLQPGSQIRIAVDAIIMKYTQHQRQDNDYDACGNNIEAVHTPVAARPNGVPTLEEVWQDFKERTSALICKLEFEINKLRSKRPWFFHAYELNTKITKLYALQRLRAQDSLFSMMEFAVKVQADKRVMRSAKRHHTSDLITDIARFMPASCIDISLLDSPPVHRC